MSENYKPGTTVIDHRGTTVTVKSVPFTAYWVQEGDGDEYIAVASDLRELPDGPRVDAAARGICAGMLSRGASGRAWDDMAEYNRTVYRNMARDALAALDAMESLAPVRPQRVVDSEGDTWERDIDGLYELTSYEGGGRVLSDTVFRGWTRDQIAGHFGPLSDA